jgi:lantibiotic modifying enzyme
VDQLCCGKAGQIEFLLCAGQLLQRPDLVEDARAYGLELLAGTDTGYATELGLDPCIYVPGFFRGESGIGYTLLRLASPNEVPAALLLH